VTTADWPEAAAARPATRAAAAAAVTYPGWAPFTISMYYCIALEEV